MLLSLFSNFGKQLRFNRALQQGFDLLNSGKKTEAYHQFKTLNTQHPLNPFVRRQILLLENDLGITKSELAPDKSGNKLR